MNLVFVMGDSDKHMGAFLSMVTLAQILEEEYKHNIVFVLPWEGDGKDLLDDLGMKNVIITSYRWTYDANLHGIQKARRFAGDIKRAIKTHRNVDKLVKLIEEENADIIHINVSDSYIGALAAIKAKKPFVWHIREFSEEDHGNKIHNRKKAFELLSKSTRLIAISNSIYKKYKAILNDAKITMIYNGIDPSRFLYPDHEILKNDVVQFLMVGKVKEGKGQRQAIQAFIKLHEKGIENIRLNIVGKVREEYFPILKKIIDEAKAEKYIVFSGQTDDTGPCYRQSDIFLMCSRAEAFGRVTVEAMLGGCLVIGANSGGTKELIQDGITGLLYESENVEDLQKKIEFALEHKNRMCELAKAGQMFMSENMTAQKNAENINRLYEEIMQEI